MGIGWVGGWVALQTWTVLASWPSLYRGAGGWMGVGGRWVVGAGRWQGTIQLGWLAWEVTAWRMYQIPSTPSCPEPCGCPMHLPPAACRALTRLPPCSPCLLTPTAQAAPSEPECQWPGQRALLLHTGETGRGQAAALGGTRREGAGLQGRERGMAWSGIHERRLPKPPEPPTQMNFRHIHNLCPTTTTPPTAPS